MKATPKQYAISLYESLKDEEKPAIIERKILNFSKILKNNNDLILIDKIVAEFDKYWNEKKGIVNLTLKSARPLLENEKNKLKKWVNGRISKLLSKKPKEIIIKEKIDKNLIGGIILQAGDLIIDGSVKTYLNNLKKQMNRT